MTEERCPKPAEESAAAGPASAASRQRKKRKWDQPAESLISAGVSVTGSFPLGVNGIVGTPLPGSVPLPSSAIPNAVLADAATASLFFHSSSITKNTAAIVQKLTQFPIQPKIQDELIAREIVINDAEPTVRYKLTKRQTQEEIQTSTGAVVITRGKYRPPNALPDSEKPLYLHISAGSHLKDTAERIKAVDRAASIVEDILKQGQNSLPSTTPSHSVINNGQAMQLLSTCLFLGFETDPSFNIAARIRGLNDQYINHIMNETGVTVVLRGQGSGNVESSICEESQQPLHLYLSSTSPQSLEAARSLAENLLHTIYIECGASRTSSCKAYCAVPSPQQMLARSRNSEEVLNVNTNPVSSLPSTPTTSMPIFPPIVPNGSSTVPPGPLPHSGTILSSGNPEPHMVYPSVNKGTCYRGYGGLYPQATPLQQVALALRKAPATTPPGLASTTSTVSVLLKPTSSTVIETEKRIPQRQKFKELPVPSKKLTVHHQNSLQGSECLKPGSEDSGVENAALMPPQNKLVHLNSSEMPPPSPPTMPPLPLVLPPKFKPPSPPPKFVAPRLLPRIKNDGEPEMMKLNSEPISDTLLKLVEYGEEEDDDTDILGKESLGNMLAQKPSSKPFWAV